MRLAIAVMLAIPASAHAAPSADDVLALVQGYYKNVAHLRGRFRQESTDATFGNTSRSEGTLELARPGKLRLDYARSVSVGVKRSFRSDGTHLWDVNHENLEIDVMNIAHSATPAALAVLTGADPKRDFTAKLTTTTGYGGHGTIVVELDARQANAAARQVFVVVDPADGRVRETATVDSSGNVSHYIFDALDPKAGVADADFAPTKQELAKYKLVVVKP